MLKSWLKRFLVTDEIFVFKTAELLKLANQHSSTYALNSPYPHAVIDGFLPDVVAERLLTVFPKPNDPVWLDWRKRDTIHQPLKQGIGHAERLERAHPFLQNVILAFNSYPVIHFLEKLTGIERLIPDPHLNGGGLHQILPGGRLAIHADFNYLESLRLYRRVNLLLFLNKDWDEAYGAHLEMWDASMRQCVKRILPVFNRCVIFNTNRTSFHGHPQPLACPQNLTRKSLAFYYYTSDSAPDDSQVHPTLWQSD
jgi:2OG-Fe(II) oxygenase superfamily